MLKELNLTYVIKEGVVMITTQEEAESTLETRVYPVGDLVLPPNAPADAQADFDSLIELITSTVKPTSWDAVGGPGSIAPFPNNLTLTISQTEEVHEAIDALLDRLRQVGRGLPTYGGHPAARPADGRQQRGPVGGGGTFGGGMGMGGMGGAPPQNPAPNAAPAKSKSQPADLLQGVQETNKGLQGRQSEKLNKMYKDSGKKKGVGAGMF